MNHRKVSIFAIGMLLLLSSFLPAAALGEAEEGPGLNQDYPEVKNIEVNYPYKTEAAKNYSQVQIRGQVSDPDGISEVWLDASSIGGGEIQMLDDGNHWDDEPNDGIYGSPPVVVQAESGYHYVTITAYDSTGDSNEFYREVKVDNIHPTLSGFNAELPAGQTAVKQGDEISFVGRAMDVEPVYKNISVRYPADVVLVLDNSGSMRTDDRWDDLTDAATSFVDGLSVIDRISIVAFDPDSSNSEEPRLYLPYATASETVDCPECGFTGTGREVAKHIINDELSPDCNTPIWDAMGNATNYAWNNYDEEHKHIPTVVSLTDGDDYADDLEGGSETFCPGTLKSMEDDANRTWDIENGLKWGVKKTYDHEIARYEDGQGSTRWRDIDLTDPGYDEERFGLVDAPLPMFNIGLGVQPQASNSSASGYLPPTEKVSTTGGASSFVNSDAYTYNFTTEYDLKKIAETSGGDYFYAPSSSDLQKIYTKIGAVINHTSRQYIGSDAPHGLKGVYAQAEELGLSTQVGMYDDGEHGDGAEDDNIYGSKKVTVNTDETKEAAVKMEAVDIARNMNDTAFQFIEVDNTNPEIDAQKVNYPSEKDWAADGEKINFQIEAGDTGSGVRKVVIDASEIGGSENLVLSPDGGNYGATAQQTFKSPDVTVSTGMETGIFTVKASVYDSANNLVTQDINVAVKNNDPMLSITSVAEGQILSGQETISVKVSDDRGVPDTEDNPVFFIDNSEEKALQRVSGDEYTAEYEGTLDTTRYKDGEHELSVKVRDTSGLQTMERLNVRIDNTEPVGSVSSPSGEEYVEGSYTFKVHASDNIELDSTTIILGQRSYSTAYNAQSGYWEVTIDTRTLEDGTHTLEAEVTDKAGHITTSTPIEFYVDNSAPTMSIAEPEKDEVLTETYELKIDSEDEGFTPEVSYRVDNKDWSEMSEGADGWTADLDTSEYMDGSHTIHFRSIDPAGHESTEKVVVFFDNYEPSFTPVSMPSGPQSGEIAVSVQPEDKVGIDVVRADLTGPSGTTEEYYLYLDEEKENYQLNLDTTDLEDGEYSLEVTIKDKAGNSITRSSDFTVDNTAPEIEYIGNEIVEKNADLDFDITDPTTDVEEVWIKIDDGEWKAVSVEEEGFSWETGIEDNGVHQVKVKAVDSAGNTAYHQEEIKVDNLNIAPIVYAVIFSVMLVVILFMTDRHIKKEEEEEEEEEKVEKGASQPPGPPSFDKENTEEPPTPRDKSEPAQEQEGPKKVPKVKKPKPSSPPEEPPTEKPEKSGDEEGGEPS